MTNTANIHDEPLCYAREAATRHFENFSHVCAECGVMIGPRAILVEMFPHVIQIDDTLLFLDGRDTNERLLDALLAAIKRAYSPLGDAPACEGCGRAKTEWELMLEKAEREYIEPDWLPWSKPGSRGRF